MNHRPIVENCRKQSTCFGGWKVTLQCTMLWIAGNPIQRFQEKRSKRVSIFFVNTVKSCCSQNNTVAYARKFGITQMVKSSCCSQNNTVAYARKFGITQMVKSRNVNMGYVYAQMCQHFRDDWSDTCLFNGEEALYVPEKHIIQFVNLCMREATSRWTGGGGCALGVPGTTTSSSWSCTAALCIPCLAILWIFHPSSP
ncbi:unnamed protein product [Urochloa humidicola]